ncbi:hypothetical protein B0T18DRAFT_168584 [Schizothecium vesticola]|uniref:Uncharacterized protein n=1 Tax=Schizothecium vesticola TaxID=314040 RepID=A0AA40ENP7_9PEZI|nr:hypothetical protein B0T18DRAFT_168584 [Schizothecium vesticola]
MALVGPSSRNNVERKDALGSAGDEEDVVWVPPITPAVPYDIKAIHSGASFSLAACRDHGEGNIGRESATQRREQAKVALEDIRALERELHRLTELALARRWSVRALLPLFIPLVARVWYAIPRSFRTAFAGGPPRSHLISAVTAGPSTGLWQEVRSARAASFAQGSRFTEAELAMVTWSSVGPDSDLQMCVTMPSTHPGRPLTGPWDAPSSLPDSSRPWSVVLQSGGFAFACVGAVASFLVLQNEAVLHLARKMARRLQNAREKLERQDDVTEEDICILSHWSWAVLLRSG